MSTLNSELYNAMQEVAEINKENGWYEGDRTFGDDIALLHSEVSEALEAFRTDGLMDTTTSLCIEKNGEAHGVDEYHICKPEGVGSEFADILVRLLDTCYRYGIDLGDEFERKIKYNRTRGYRHGGKRL